MLSFLLKWRPYFFRLSFAHNPVLTTTAEIKETPKRLVIPSLNINLEVTPGVITDGNWEISQTGVSYLQGSGLPGKPGNLVIYGHNKKNLLGPLISLKKEAEIIIENEQNQKFTYEVTETKIVSPEKVEVLKPTSDARLTLYTCTGFFDGQRLVVVAKLK